MANRDKRFAEAALRSIKIRESYTHSGLLHGGADLITRNAPGCIQHTIANLKGLTTAIHKGLSGSLKPGKIALPSDNATGVREWPEASVLQISHGPWRASVTTNDLATSPKRGNHPMGGALSMLWNKNTAAQLPWLA